jgi:hypothetical protein
VTARTVPDRELDTPAVIAHGRIVVLGRDTHRLHEEIISAGGTLQEGRFRRITTVSEVDRLIDAALPTPVPETLQQRFKKLWPDIEGNLLAALQRRMEDRTRNLEKLLDERMQTEIGDLRAILSALQRHIEAELARAEAPLQLELWSDTERDQRDQDRNNMRVRLAGIPEELAREEEILRRRYADPVPRLFPIAVTFLVPERLAIPE